MLEQEFLDRATSRTLDCTIHPFDDAAYRESLLEHFQTIQEQLTCAHAPSEAWILADAILREPHTGPVIECGVYQGGMTCKLSRVCRDTRRELFVCDSFAGIPSSETSGEEYEYYRERKDVIEKFGQTATFHPGEYCGPIGDVIQNLRQFGHLEICRFVVGWFADTLPRLDVSPALVMIDVDLVESGRDCLKALWPKLRGVSFFTHEAFIKRYMEGILNPEWWERELGEEVPPVTGDIYGLHEIASCLARLEKVQQAVASL